MVRYHMKYLLLLVILACCFKITGQPDFARSFQVSGELIIPDQVDSELAYVFPLPFCLGEAEDGYPAFRLSKYFYTGNHNTGDSDKNYDFGDLAISMTMPSRTTSQWAALKHAVAATSEIETFSVLPIRYFVGKILLTVGGNKGTISSSEGFSRTTGAKLNFSFALNSIETELLLQILEEGGEPILIDYQLITSNFKGVASKDTMVLQRTDKITFPPDQAPRLLRRVNLDGNSRWVDCPVLDVLCFDFTREDQQGLYKKIIELRAKPYNDEFTEFVKESFTFSNRDLVHHRLSFSSPVRMDLPFDYRITEISVDGKTKKGEWIRQHDWDKVDITYYPKSEEDGF